MNTFQFSIIVFQIKSKKVPGDKQRHKSRIRNIHPVGQVVVWVFAIDKKVANTYLGSSNCRIVRNDRDNCIEVVAKRIVRHIRYFPAFVDLRHF